ncbi:Bug family tripartite tricarboxylate transporter substrate binding protein [Aliihoeflea sp. PC F10.4]
MAERFILFRAGQLMMAITALAIGTSMASAQSDYPSEPIELVVPFAPGGAGDGSGRVMAQFLGEELGQQVNVINMAGGNTIPAVLHVMNAAPDGHTLLWDGPATSSIQMSVGELPYDPTARYFGPRVNDSPYYLAVPSNSPYQTLDDLVQAMKANPTEIDIAWLGGVSMTDTVLLSFLSVAGVNLSDVTLVPFTGSGPAATALAGGHLDLAIGAIPAVVPLYQAGSVRVLALAGDQRFDVLPDAPSSKEAGYFIPLTGWNAIGGPPGMPDDIAARIDEAVKKVTDDPEFAAAIEMFSYLPLYMTPEQNREEILKEGEELSEIRAAANL